MNTGFTGLLRMNNATDFRFRWTLSTGLASASSSQRYWSNKVRPISFLRVLQLKLSRWSRHLPLQSI